MADDDDSYDYFQDFGQDADQQSIQLSTLNVEETHSLVSIKVSCIEVNLTSEL